MKRKLLTLFACCLLAACSGSEPDVEPSADSGAGNAAPVEHASATPAAANHTDSDPCAALDEPLVPYDVAGKPVQFTLEIPRGWTVQEDFNPTVSDLDVVKDVDNDGSNEFILRFAQSNTRNDHISGTIETWQKARTIKVLDIDLADGTVMHVAEPDIGGDVIGYQAMFPAEGSNDSGYLVIVGLTENPKPCHDKALEVLKAMMGTFGRNHQKSAPPDHY